MVLVHIAFRAGACSVAQVDDVEQPHLWLSGADARYEVLHHVNC